MRLVERSAARFDNTKIYSRYKAGKLSGRHIWIGGIFRLGNPNLNPIQFMGLHDCLLVTINYPSYVRDIITLAADFPFFPEKTYKENQKLDRMTWFSQTRCFVGSSKKNKDNDRDGGTGAGGIRFYVPGTVWGESINKELRTIKTKSFLSVVNGTYGGTYHVITFPSVTRKMLLALHAKGN